MNISHLSGQKHSFTFDRVFMPDAPQEDVFVEISQLVQSALDGYKVICLNSDPCFLLVSLCTCVHAGPVYTLVYILTLQYLYILPHPLSSFLATCWQN